MKTISADTKNTVLIFRTFKIIFISLHYPFNWLRDSSLKIALDSVKSMHDPRMKINPFVSISLIDNE
jgi:hypothetical protein